MMKHLASAIAVFLAFQVCAAQEKPRAQGMNDEALKTPLGQVRSGTNSNSRSVISMVPKVIKLDSTGKDYLRVLGGPPESSSMRSGLVTLAPNKSVGKHSTENYEELVIVFEGSGRMDITDGDSLSFTKGEVLYCPPFTEHNVTNTGNEILRYLYVVAEAKR
jgi:mannose-6-phosphate isomerase-like protein (cupin superfamily)